MKITTHKKLETAQYQAENAVSLSVHSAKDIAYFPLNSYATSAETAKALRSSVARFNSDLKAAKAALAALNKAVKVVVAEHRASIAKDAAKLKAKRKAKAGGKATGATTSATVN